jgi:hypothetical protein
MACKGDHTTTWYTFRGDEREFEVHGATRGFKLELICQSGDEFHTQELRTGKNPLPPKSFQRYRVSKRLVLRGAQEVATTVKVLTR